MRIQTLTPEKAAREILKRPRALRGARVELLQEEAAHHPENVRELVRLTKLARKEIERGRPTGAERAVKKTVARWIREERYGPAVAACEWIQRQQNRLNKESEGAAAKNWELLFLTALETHGVKEKPVQNLVNALRAHAEKPGFGFDRIRLEILKMMEADIRGRVEPFEGPPGSTSKTRKSGLDAIEGKRS